MRFNRSILVKVLVIQSLALACVAQDFDFFFFVQQWPGSYCDTRKGCCYPKTGKPKEDFGVHGLWPNYNDGTYPSDCDNSNSFDESQISGDLESTLEQEWPTLACPSGDGLKFWGHEWDKHGTCTESTFDQAGYFQAALDLKKKSNLLQALVDAGIRPANGEFHTLESLSNAIKKGVGYTPYIECNVDGHGNHQIYQVYLCVDKSGTKFIECPTFPHGRGCGSSIEFPSFASGKARSHEEL